MIDKQCCSFIKTCSDDWNLAFELDPTIKKVLPTANNEDTIISFVGTCGDGKSTLANTFINSMENVHIKSPFKTCQSDEAVTNGIDYVKINNYIIFDHQGISHNSAKYDHYLMLIAYLISDVIVLTVRERLDLQVLNSCLSLFSFLPDIPEKYRRESNPTLLLRIKDFQNASKIYDDEYFIEYVNKWLQKSNDQYSKIKEIFTNSFNIKCVATCPPTLNNNFDDQSFKHVVDKIYNIQIEKKTQNLLDCDETIINLIHDLKNNKLLDFKKLDLYYNITVSNMRKYLRTNIDKYQKIIHSNIPINGTKDTYDKIIEEENNLLLMKDEIYTFIFRDVSKDIIDEVFNKTFTDLFNYINNLKELNIRVAHNQIKKDFQIFCDKFDILCIDDIDDIDDINNPEDTNLKYVTTHIIEHFNNHKTKFLNKVNNYDQYALFQYIDIIDREYKIIENIQYIINENNKNQQILLKEKLTDCIYKIKNIIHSHFLNDVVQCSNKSLSDFMVCITPEFYDNIDSIFREYDKIFYITKNNEIESKYIYCERTVQKYFKNIKLDMLDIEKYFWNIKHEIFTKYGFLCDGGYQTKTINAIQKIKYSQDSSLIVIPKCNQEIKFVKIVFPIQLSIFDSLSMKSFGKNMEFLMTQLFFEKINLLERINKHIHVWSVSTKYIDKNITVYIFDKNCHMQLLDKSTMKYINDSFFPVLFNLMADICNEYCVQLVTN